VSNVRCRVHEKGAHQKPALKPTHYFDEFPFSGVRFAHSHQDGAFLRVNHVGLPVRLTRQDKSTFKLTLNLKRTWPRRQATVMGSLGGGRSTADMDRAQTTEIRVESRRFAVALFQRVALRRRVDSTKSTIFVSKKVYKFGSGGFMPC